MHRIVAWLCLSGCNQLFDLQPTAAIDAKQFDAGIDAPFACPDAGSQPQFSALLHQAITRNCVSYTTSQSANRAAAFCLDLDAIGDGAIDATPELATLTPPGPFDMPRVTPEGDELWVRDRSAGTAKFKVYSWAAEHRWTYVRDLAIPSSGLDDELATPSRRVNGIRRFMRYAFGARELDEYDDDGSTTSFVRSYTEADLGVAFISFPNLGGDGLRLVFVSQAPTGGEVKTYYADRAALDRPLSAAVVLSTAPVALDPFLTEDCGRLYTNGLGSIFYAQQQ